MATKRPSLKGRALSFLARREHTRLELQRKLAPHADDPGAIESLLDELEKRGWLSEARFVEQTVTRLARRYGARRIAHALREKGVAQDSIAKALPPREEEIIAAQRALKRKFPLPPANLEEKARRMRFLQNRGFDYDVICKVIESGSDE
jgi:regulatory protein